MDNEEIAKSCRIIAHTQEQIETLFQSLIDMKEWRKTLTKAIKEIPVESEDELIEACSELIDSLGEEQKLTFDVRRHVDGIIVQFKKIAEAENISQDVKTIVENVETNIALLDEVLVDHEAEVTSAIKLLQDPTEENRIDAENKSKKAAAQIEHYIKETKKSKKTTSKKITKVKGEKLDTPSRIAVHFLCGIGNSLPVIGALFASNVPLIIRILMGTIYGVASTAGFYYGFDGIAKRLRAAKQNELAPGNQENNLISPSGN